MESLAEEHCPGPPVSPSQLSTEFTDETLDINLSQQLHRREVELQQLKNEVQTYAEKLRGYQTLSELYAESQKECSGYKHRNEELVRQLSGLMRRLSLTTSQQNTDDPAVQPQAENEIEITGKHGNDVVKPGRSLLLDFTEQRDDGEKEHDRESASVSSPSFVNINSSISSPDDRSAVATHLQDAAESSSLSVDIERLTTELRDAAHHHIDDDTSRTSTPAANVAASYQDVSSNLIRTSLSVLKLERQTRLQKAMMEQMAMKITELNDQLNAKEQTIAKLQEDCTRLAANMTSLRDEVSLKSLTTTETETTKDADRQTSDQQQQSGDWLAVDKRVSSAGSVDIAAVSTTEMELKRRVDKLNATIAELVAVNRSWDDHCKQLESSHTRQMAALNAELSDVRRRLDERQKSDSERQSEFDDLLLSSKKQREDEEMAKEDALCQLHAEKHQRAVAEDRCLDFSRKVAELEAQLYALQMTGTQNGVPSQHSVSMSSSLHETSDKDMKLELQILREQVTVFKEDFDQERRDREASRATMEHLDTRYRETSVELSATKKKLTDALASLRAVKTENMQLKDRFYKVADDLKTLQRHAVATPPSMRPYVPTTPTQPYVPLQSPAAYHPTQPQHMYGIGGATGGSGAGHHVWACDTCTFENAAGHTSCEMCGRLKTAEQALYRRDLDVNRQHRVAGLRELHFAEPVAHSDWPRLPSSNLETDQSPHQQL